MNTIKYRLIQVNNVLRNSNRLTFVLILVLVLYMVAFLFNVVFISIKEKDIVWFTFPGEQKSYLILFLSTIIVSPIIETFINQYLPYFLLNKIKYFREHNYLILLSSALLFGLIHFYSLFYIFYAFIIGLVLMYSYMIRIKTDNMTFYLIAISHSFLNCGILVMRVL